MLRLEEAVRANELLKDKMRLYSGETGVDTSDLERALTLVKRHTDRPSEVDFLDNDMEDIDDMEAVPALRKRIQKLQIKQLEQQRELDRADRMLKAQSSINRDLNTELETLKARYTADKSTLQKKVDDMEHVATKRTARIKTLEAQVKQSMRSARNDISYGLKGDDGAMATNGSQTVADSALAHPDVDFEPGENILEIYIVEATLLNGDAIPPGSIMVGGEATTLSPNSTTFVMCDF